MPRFLVHVNHNAGKKRIRVHAESKRPCGNAFLNVRNGRPQGFKFHIERLDETTFQTADVKHSYWLIVWAADRASVLTSRWVKEAQKKYRIPAIKVTSCGNCK